MTLDQETTMTPALAMSVVTDAKRARRRVVVPASEKWCVACKQMRSRELFETNRKTCIDCAPAARDRSGEWAAVKRYREAHRDELKARQLAKAREHFAWMDSLKIGSCADCGVVYPPYVLDWDHIRGEKSFNLGVMRSRYGYKNVRKLVLIEIAKCDLVCSNCHRERTRQRRVEGESP